ncbi:MAG TPA: excinuclease ABC subunit UvrA, partial [bacterium]|nr:excinuclease ABC subunit UvrA [bacterium]
MDLISGLSPAISIEQKAAIRNPRSTVGTVTEIYDYLRVLYARIGLPHCPKCGRAVGAQTLDQIVDRILLLESGTRFLVLAPIVRGRKGEYREILDEARREGFLRVRINGTVRSLEDEIQLDKRMKHDLEIVVDRLVLREEIRSRLTDSVSTALHLGDGVVVISLVDKNEDLFYSERHACAACGLSLEDLTPQHFSFNSPHGMCPVCDGLGQKLRFDPDLIIPEKTLSISKGAIAPLRRVLDARGVSRQGKVIQKALEIVGEDFGFDLNVPWEQLSPQQQNVVLYGIGRDNYCQARWSKRTAFPGIIPQLEKWLEGPELSGARSHFTEGYMSMAVCPECMGGRLRSESAAVTLNERTIVDVVRMSIRECLKFFSNLTLTPTEKTIAEEVLREISGRLQFLENVGLHYLTLDRSAPSLSGGEAQRIRLASQIGSGLVGVLYILDEPSIGLHQKDNRQLLQTLLRLRDLGNTVLVVEHDAEIIHNADWIVDFGPGAGELGGEIVASGTLDTILQSKDSLTGKFLSGKRSIPIPAKRRTPSSKWLTVRGARENNLKSIDVSFPLGLITCVTGVSGSGKSSLVNEILYNWLARTLNRAQTSPGTCDAVEGAEWLDKVINID